MTFLKIISALFIFGLSGPAHAVKIPVKWKVCNEDKDCSKILGMCHEYETVHNNFVADLQDLITEKMKTVDCAIAPSSQEDQEGFEKALKESRRMDRQVAACVKKTCQLVDPKENKSK